MEIDFTYVSAKKKWFAAAVAEKMKRDAAVVAEKVLFANVTAVKQ